MKKIIITMVVFLLSGCTSASYYTHIAEGHFSILSERKSIERILVNQETDKKLREKLEKVVQIRDFSVDTLHLPDNGSYKSYVQLDRPYVVWAVTAAEEFSIKAKTWCFPVAGCVAYRGYYSEEKARGYEKELRQQGFDTAVRGVAAYSTLSWFDDPVLSSFIAWRAPYLAGLIFHELAHQKIYCKGDSTFNEGFAEAVEEIGIRLWLAGQPEGETILRRWENRNEAHRKFIRLLLDTRQQLAKLYAKDLPVSAMRVEKMVVLKELKEGYEKEKLNWHGQHFDSWFKREVNNARLVSVSTYNSLKQPFLDLYKAAGSDLSTFYEEVEKLASLPEEIRHKELIKEASAQN